MTSVRKYFKYLNKNGLSILALLALITLAINLKNRNNKATFKVQTLEHFEKNKSPEKLKASEFLISNSKSHFSFFWNVKDYYGNTISNFKPERFKNTYQARDSLFKLKAQYQLDSIISDHKQLQADYLVKNIDLAFLAKEKYSWCKKLTTEQFNNYVLPYRIGNERLNNWRSYFYQKYQSLADSCEQVQFNAIDFCIRLNNEIKKDISYNSACSILPGHDDYSQVIERKQGDCIGMTHFATWAMRSLGLAIAKDEAPYWGNYDYGHSWNVLITKSESIPFGGCGDNPGKMPLYYRAPKVFRHSFSVNEDRTIKQELTKYELPKIFTSPNLKDVTDQYYNTLDITINIKKRYKFVFLCVFNGNKWVPVELGEKKWWSSKVTFHNMTDSLLYMPGYYQTGSITPAGYPFFIDSNGSKIIFEPDRKAKVTIDKIWSYSYWNGNVTKKNHEYTLYLWDHRWIPIAQEKSKPHTYDSKSKEWLLINDQSSLDEEKVKYFVTFYNIPASGLYRLENDRPFWLEKGQRVRSMPGEKIVYKKLISKR